MAHQDESSLTPFLKKSQNLVLRRYLHTSPIDLHESQVKTRCAEKCPLDVLPAIEDENVSGVEKPHFEK